MDVVFIILLDSLGLHDVMDSIRDALLSILEFVTATEEIEAAAKERDYGRLIQACVDAAKILMREDILREILSRLPDGVAVRLLKVIASFGIPFLRLALFLIDLELAILRHWDRLMDAIERS